MIEKKFINMFIAQFVHSIHVKPNDILKDCITENQNF